MKHSRKAARMARHHARAKKAPVLNLTALMDIFTILVFFLMVNSGDEQLIKDTETILMPRSIASEMPKESLLISVDSESITIQGQIVATIAEINAMKNESSEDDIIPLLKAELDRQAARRTELTPEEKILGRPVTIQGDQKVPYLVLRKIMATSAMSGYRNISLAVVQKELKVEDVEAN